MVFFKYNTNLRSYKFSAIYIKPKAVGGLLKKRPKNADQNRVKEHVRLGVCLWRSGIQGQDAESKNFMRMGAGIQKKRFNQEHEYQGSLKKSALKIDSRSLIYIFLTEFVLIFVC